MEQRYTSKSTSNNQVSNVYRFYKFKPKSTILDYGGGKFDANKEFMSKQGIEVYIYDKYNRTFEHNTLVMCKMRHYNPDYIVCANVLNVIYENEIIDEILQELSEFNSTVLISVYEGNKTGIGRVTQKGYQRNEKMDDYIEKIEKYFDITDKRFCYIECKSKKPA